MADLSKIKLNNTTYNLKDAQARTIFEVEGILEGDGEGNISAAGTTATSTLNIDSEPTPDSDNLVTSGGVYDAIQAGSGIANETDPIFSNSAAAGITSTDITNWNNKVSDTGKWNDVTLTKSTTSSAGSYYLPSLSATSSTTAYLYKATSTPENNVIVKYDNNAYLNSTTPSSGDNTTKVATTAFVSSAISALGSVLNYKGTKTTVSNLPTTNNTAGDVWIVTADNSEHVWNGSSWEQLGTTTDLSGYLQSSDISDWAKASTKPSYTASEVGAATSSHTHGNITNGGDITATAPTIASGDKIIINDESASKITNGPSFGTSTTTYLRNDGSWATPASAVTSVNTKTGAVILSASDVGALPDSTVIPQGTVTSVRVQASSPLQSSTSTEQNTSLNTTISFSSQNKNLVLAGPSSGSTAAAPTFRSLVADDIPTITKSKISDFPTIDSTPTDGNANNLVSSDGVYDKILARTKIYTASCSTAAGTAAKVATLDDSSGFNLAAGVMVAVRFQYGNSATTPTLRVDGSSTGTAKTITFSTAYNSKTTGNGTTYNTWGPYETVIFTYDGTYWVNSGSSLSIYNAYNKANSIVVPSAADAAPLMDGTATVGTSTDYAREDHIHPTDTSRAASSHTHGDITNSGDITATAPTIASGDKIIINDESASKITNGPSFGTSTTTYLRNDGSWNTPTDNRDPGYGQIKAGAASSSTSAITANTTTAQASTYNETLTINPGNKWLSVAANNSSTAGSDTFTIGHSASLTAKTSYGSTATTASANGGTITVTDIKYDEAGHITASTDRTITLSQVDNDTKNTAGSTDTSSKIYLIGATSQAANPQTYSDNEVYATSGVLNAKTFSGTNAELQNIKMVTTLTAITSNRGDLGSSVSPRYLPYEWYASLGHNPTNGEIIVIRTPSAGNTAGVYLSINGNTEANYYPIATGGTSRVTTHFASGTTLMLVYESSMTVTTYALAGADSTSTITGIWRVLNFYDSNTNTLLRTYKATNSIELPLLLRNSTASQTAANASISTYHDGYGAIANTNSPTVNPSTGAFTVNGVTNLKEKIILRKSYNYDTVMPTETSATTGQLYFTSEGVGGGVSSISQTLDKIYMVGIKSESDDTLYYNENVYAQNNVLYGAAWNDYAEYRESFEIEPGRVIIELGNGRLIRSTDRLQPGAEIISDTYGFIIGKGNPRCSTPVAVCGRVLAYTYEDRHLFGAGDAVCSGPNGTVSKMTREEIKEYPERIIGTVSEVPEYETWGTGNIKVNNRIWIRLR